MRLKIAVVQFKLEANLDAALKKAERYIKKAAFLKADIITFPENFLSTNKKDTIDKNEKIVKIFQNLAKKNKIDIIPGSVIVRGKDKKLYNTSYYIDLNGKIKCRYKKIHLWISERRSYYSGKKIKAFRTRFGKAGLIICWDLMFPKIFEGLDKKGVKIVFCPSDWCYGDARKGLKYDSKSELKLINSLCTERAFENEIILVFCNNASEENERILLDKSVGHSQVTEPFKGAVKRFNHNREGMFVCKVDTKIIRDAEKSYKIREDSKK